MCIRRYFCAVGIIILVAFLITGTANAKGNKRKTVYVDPNAITSTDVRFTDTDLRLLTAKMIESMITSAFPAKTVASDAMSTGGEGAAEKPVLAVGELENRTSQNIDLKLILDTIETGVLKSGACRFVNRSQVFRRAAADESALQQTMGDGAPPAPTLITYQYRIDGAINEIVQNGGKQRYYKLYISLTNIRTSEKIWAEESELKKAK